jgi:hypothetical protein
MRRAPIQRLAVQGFEDAAKPCKKLKHAKRNIVQCDVLMYKRRRKERRWQDMANVCTFCPRGLTRAEASEKP